MCAALPFDALSSGRYFFQDADRSEAVGELEAEHGIADLALDDLLQIVLRGADLARDPAIAGHAPAEDDAFQVELLDEAAARLVQPLADPEAALLGIDRELEAIEPVAGRIVAAAEAVAGDRLPIMRRHHQRLVDP